MSWVRLRRPTHCSRCGRDLVVGDAARLGDRVRSYTWCVDCAWSGLQERPPDDPPPQDLAPLAGSQRELAFDDPTTGGPA